MSGAGKRERKEPGECVGWWEGGGENEMGRGGRDGSAQNPRDSFLTRHGEDNFTTNPCYLQIPAPKEMWKF